MPRKVSDAERILSYFRTAPLETAQVVMDLAKAEVRQRSGKVTAQKTRPIKVNRSVTPTQETQNVA